MFVGVVVRQTKKKASRRTELEFKIFFIIHMQKRYSFKPESKRHAIAC